MIIKKTPYLVITLLTLLLSCNNNDDNKSVPTIKIDPSTASESINLSDVVESLEYIPLITSEDNLMGNVMEVVIKNKYIYASTQGGSYNIFVFNKNGEFVAKLDKTGRGPSEYLYLDAFFVSDDESEIEILSGDKRFIYNNISFEHIKTVEMPDVMANDFARKDNFYYYAGQQIENYFDDDVSNPSLIIADNSANVYIHFDKIVDSKRGNHYYNLYPNAKSFAENDKKELFISIMYDNTFYKLEDTTASSYLAVDFGSYGIDNDYIGARHIADQIKYFETASNVASFPVLNVENDKMSIITYNYKNSDKLPLYNNENLGSIHHYIKLKNSDKVFHATKIKNDITEFPEYVDFCSFLHAWHQPQYENYLVDVILPYNYIPEDAESVETKALGTITVDDNPIVVMMKLKK